MTLHIHAPQASDVKLVELACPTCGKPCQMLAEFTDWYGWRHTCLTCGDSWADGERMPRPFARGWRKQAVDEATKRAKAKGLLEQT